MRVLFTAVAIAVVAATMTGPAVAAERPAPVAATGTSAAVRIEGGEVAPARTRPAVRKHDVPSAAEVLARVQQRQEQSADGAGGSDHDAFTGDMDGDGLPDVLTYTRTGEDQLSLTARRGMDGAHLWSRSLGDGYFQPARVGTAGQGGAYVYEYPNDQRGWRFTAVDAAGETAWQKQFQATPAATPVSSGRVRALYDFWFVDAAKGPATDLVLSFWTYQDTPAGFLLTVEAQVIDGATGQVAMTTSETALDFEPEVAPISDIDGDGVDDIVIAVYDYQGSGSVSVRSGATGLVLWHNPSVPLAFGSTTFTPAGDLNGDGRQEVIAAYEWWYDYWSYSLWGVVLDGVKGLELFDVDGVPYRLGDIDGDGNDELGALQVTYDDDELGVWIVTYDRRGAEVASTGNSFDISDATDGAAWASTVGDVDGDDVTDAHFALWVRSRNGALVKDTGVVAGSSGDVLWTGEESLPIHTTVDAAGDDYLRLHWGYGDAGQTEITPIDGRTGWPLWQQTVPGSTGYLYDAIDVDGDGGADLLWVDSRNDVMTLLRSADGHVMWSD